MRKLWGKKPPKKIYPSWLESESETMEAQGQSPKLETNWMDVAEHGKSRSGQAGVGAAGRLGRGPAAQRLPALRVRSPPRPPAPYQSAHSETPQPKPPLLPQQRAVREASKGNRKSSKGRAEPRSAAPPTSLLARPLGCLRSITKSCITQWGFAGFRNARVVTEPHSSNTSLMNFPLSKTGDALGDSP